MLPFTVGNLPDARGGVRLSTPAGERNSQPGRASEQNLIAGGKMYLNECAGCHGTPGKSAEICRSSEFPAPATGGGGDRIFGSPSLLGGEARNPHERNVCQRRLAFGPGSLDGRGLHQAHEQRAPACERRVGKVPLTAERRRSL